MVDVSSLFLSFCAMELEREGLLYIDILIVSIS